MQEKSDRQGYRRNPHRQHTTGGSVHSPSSRPYNPIACRPAGFEPADPLSLPHAQPPRPDPEDSCGSVSTDTRSVVAGPIHIPASTSSHRELESLHHDAAGGCPGSIEWTCRPDCARPSRPRNRDTRPSDPAAVRNRDRRDRSPDSISAGFSPPPLSGVRRMSALCKAPGQRRLEGPSEQGGLPDARASPVSRVWPRPGSPGIRRCGTPRGTTVALARPLGIAPRPAPDRKRQTMPASQFRQSST